MKAPKCKKPECKKRVRINEYKEVCSEYCGACEETGTFQFEETVTLTIRANEIEKIDFRRAYAGMWSDDHAKANYSARMKMQDSMCVGTKHYQGLAWFWGGNGMKHYLRDANANQRKRVHNKWLKAGLDLWGCTDEHEQIVFDVMNNGKKF